MIINFRQEIWTPYKNENWSEEDQYLISNYGRVQRKKVYEEEWKLSKTSLIGGYDSFWIRKKGKKSSSSCYVHRLVATLYSKRREDQKFVIHLDFDKLNNKASNLKWVNRVELNEHNKNNPIHEKRLGKRTYAKLTEGRVRMIKKKIFDPNRRTRMRLIAKQFGISEMQLYRIKSGENWGSVKIDD
jgi:hypothetical protein